MSNDHDAMTTDVAPAPTEPQAVGLLLRQARESAGLTLDAVAQQLKLAPRQVEALEAGDYSRLPGRTFVRGFMRNYARLLHLDPDAILSALAGASATPSLEAPALHATTQSFGELPTAQRARAGWTRWGIPLVLIAIVAGAAYYEYQRQGEAARNGASHPATPTKSIGEATTPLPNPLANGNAPAPAPTASEPVLPPPGAQTPAESVAANAPATTPAAAAPTAAAPAEEATIVINYRDFSWTEVRDRTGRVLLMKMMSAGQQQTLTGTPPFDVVIGNSADVKLTYRGKPIDLGPLSRGNVARFTLNK